MLASPPVTLAGQVRLAKLMKQYEVFLVTRIQPAGVQFARQWLQERWLAPDTLVSVGPGGDKSRVLEHGFQVYVDDDVTQLGELVPLVPHLFLLDTPYNHTHELPERVTRVRDWQELEERITQLGETRKVWSED
ncbi:MAG TPA: hypothetical protein VLF60_02810 [Candidatus Saccharimonadales bacterium]|nr:hypothetical protein [Candidatus Saccharimonadales bacterium]